MSLDHKPTVAPSSSAELKRSFDIESWFEAWQDDYVFFSVDHQGVLTSISPSVRSILGYKPSELVGHSASEYFDLDHPLHVQLQDLSDRIFSGHGQEPRHCVARRADGSFSFLSIRERQIKDETGAVLTTEAVASDVTQRIEAELSLQKSELKYRRLVEGLKSDYVFYSYDPEGYLTYVSPSVQRVLGFPPEGWMGMHWGDVVGEHFLGRETAEKLVTNMRDAKQSHKFTTELEHPDGGGLLVEFQEFPIAGPDGQYVAMEGIAKDITEMTRSAEELKRLKEELELRVAQRTAELRRSNEELKRSENRYRKVVEDQTEFIVRWLPDGTCNFVNDAYCRYFGRSREELIGSDYVPLIFEEDRPTVLQEIASLTPEHPFATNEHRVYRADGSIGWNMWTNRTLFDEQGNALEFQSVGRDITELRAAADTIREKEAHLAHVSRLSTMGEMVAGIAHEIHQPLHAAKTFAEAARRNLEGDRPKGVETAIDCTAEISQAMSRAAEIIRRLRDFTQARSVSYELLDLNGVITVAVEILAFETRKSQVALRLDLDPELPLIQGDRIQLEQVGINLLKNACEAMAVTPLEERTLVVTTRESGDWVEVSFCDAGCGIESEVSDRLFDAFYSTKSGGMGMGLTLCKSIADVHRGRLSVHNNDDAGTTFVLALPKPKKRMP